MACQCCHPAGNDFQKDCPTHTGPVHLINHPFARKAAGSAKFRSKGRNRLNTTMGCGASSGRAAKAADDTVKLAAQNAPGEVVSDRVSITRSPLEETATRKPWRETLNEGSPRTSIRGPSEVGYGSHQGFDEARPGEDWVPPKRNHVRAVESMEQLGPSNHPRWSRAVSDARRQRRSRAQASMALCAGCEGGSGVRWRLPPFWVYQMGRSPKPLNKSPPLFSEVMPSRVKRRVRCPCFSSQRRL